jgi:hypothetical protein
MVLSARPLWSEGGAGTNAIGTALAPEHAVQVFASEHPTRSFMSTHYGRMVVLDDRIIMFADPEDAAE